MADLIPAHQRFVGTAKVRYQYGHRVSGTDLAAVYEPTTILRVEDPPTGAVFRPPVSHRAVAQPPQPRWWVRAYRYLRWWWQVPISPRPLSSVPVSPTVRGPRVPHTCYAAPSRPCHACDIADDAAYERAMDQ